MKATTLSALAALTVTLAGCAAPGVEAGAAGLLVGRPSAHQTSSVEPGYASTIALGVYPTEHSGATFALEGQAAEDKARGVSWTARLRGGWSFPLLDEHLALEPAVDLGLRIDGGLFQTPPEVGTRLTVVIPITSRRTPADRNRAFVFVSRNVDLAPFLRAGYHLDRTDKSGPLATDLTLGITARVWMWTDIF